MFIKIRIRNKKHSEDVQKMLLALGCKWWNGGDAIKYTDEPFIYVTGIKLFRCDDVDLFNYDNGTEVLFDWLLSARDKVDVEVDGKKFKISRESWDELKKNLVEG